MRLNARADIHDGQERSAPRKGRIQKRKTNTSVLKIQLATRGRSIQMGQTETLGLV